METTPNPLEELKATHNPGVSGLLKIFPVSRLVLHVAFLSSCVLAAVLLVFTNIFSLHIEMIKVITQAVLTIIPGLLGVVLAAYALIIAFFSDSTLDRITRPLKEKPYSLFQSTNAGFAISVIILCLILIFGFTVSIFTSIADKIIVPYLLAIISNNLILFILTWGLSYGILLCIVSALNIFGIGQTTDFLKNIDRLKSLHTPPTTPASKSDDQRN